MFSAYAKLVFSITGLELNVFHMVLVLSSSWFIGVMHTLSAVFFLEPDVAGVIKAENTIRYAFSQHSSNFTHSHMNNSTDTDIFLGGPTSVQLALTNTMLFLGWLFGSSIFSGLSDRFGRKKVIGGSMILTLLSLALQWLANTFVLFAASRFLQGFGIGANGVVTYVWGSELLMTVRQKRALQRLSALTSHTIGSSEPPYHQWTRDGLSEDEADDRDSVTPIAPIHPRFGINSDDYVPVSTIDYGGSRRDETAVVVTIHDSQIDKEFAAPDSQFHNEMDDTGDDDVISSKARTSAGSLFQFQWSVGSMVLSLLAFLVPHWQNFTVLLFFLSAFAFLMILLCVPESPQYRLLNLQRITSSALPSASSLHRNTPPSSTQTLFPPTDQTLSKNTLGRQLLTMMEPVRILFTRYLGDTLLLSVIWIANALLYYGLSFNSSHIPGNIYLLTALMSFVAIPGQLSSIFLSSYRHLAVIAGMAMLSVIFSLMLFLAIMYPDAVSKSGFNDSVSILLFVLNLLGTLIITMTFTLCYVITVITFPTTIRNSGLGYGVVMGRIGGMLAPLVIMSGPQQSFFVFALVSAVCCVCVYWGRKSGGKEEDEVVSCS